MSVRPPEPSRRLTIGVDARAAAEVGAGRGRVVRELLVAFGEEPTGHNWVCYARTRWDRDLGERFSWRTIHARDPAWHVLAARSASRECDVFLSSNSYLTVPLLRIPAVALVYDLIAFQRSMRPNLRSTIVERLTLGAAVRRASGLVCISHTTRDELIARYPSAQTKTTVALLGVSPSLSTEPAADLDGSVPAGGFVLAVGTLEPRKNLPRLVDAYRTLPERLQDEHPLIVVGARGWQTGETLAALQSLGPRCMMLGSVSDRALSELYRRCAVFCYPSLGEGFGLPVLEAMAAGAAVLTSNVSSLPEVGGDAVELVDPDSVQSIAAGLIGLLESPQRRAALGARARHRASLFSWASTAVAVREALELAARGAAVPQSRNRIGGRLA
jgi:alpha-1,3-rhamnosyl/mannosyltransferase